MLYTYKLVRKNYSKCTCIILCFCITYDIYATNYITYTLDLYNDRLSILLSLDGLDKLNSFMLQPNLVEQPH